MDEDYDDNYEEEEADYEDYEDEEEDPDIDEELGLELEDRDPELGEMNIDSKGVNRLLRLDSYEKAQLLGKRALLIDSGKPSTIDFKELKSLGITGSLQIAEEELRRGILPLKLRRKMDIGPDQVIKLSDIEFVYG